MQESIFSKSMPGGGKTYFFDVKQAQGGKQSKYVQVTELRKTKEGQNFRSSITIFPEQLKAFQEAFQEAVEKVS